MERRTFLKRGLVGGGLIVLAGSGLFLWPTRKRFFVPKPLKVFDEREFQVMAAVASRVITQPGADAAAIAAEVDAEVALLCPELRGDTKNLLVLFENALAGLVLDGRARPFTRLSESDQDAALYAWRDSRIELRRAGYHSLRKLCFSAFYRDPKTWPLAGYLGPPLIVPGKPT